MDKPFKTIDEQYEILLSRGMVFSNPELSKRYLLFNNYYNVINGYGHFLLEKDGKYYDNCMFTEVIAIRQFDSQFKNTLLKAILDVENYFKSALSYEFSKAHSTEILPYLNPNNFNGQLLTKNRFIADMNKIINKYAMHHSPNSIKHYYKNHDDIPFWVFCDYMSFGQLVTMYSLLPKSIQNAVAKDFSNLANINLDPSGKSIKITPSDLYRIIGNTKDVRNILAHNNMLFNYTLKSGIPYYEKIHDPLKINKTDQRQSIYDIFVILRLFLNEKQYNIYYNSILDRIKKLHRKMICTDCCEILKSLGFPSDYYLKDKIK